MHRNNWYVYMHTTPSGMVYIGISHFEDPNIRWKNGLGYKHNPHFNNAIQKYGWNNITHEIIEKNLDFETANQREIDYILEYKHLGICYNITDGGDGHYGQKFTKEHKQKISNTLKQKHQIPWNKGKTGVYSDETRQKMGAGMRGKVGPNKGKKRPPVSQETRKKLSESLKGKNTWSKGSKRGHYSEEHRKHISESLKGKRKGIPLGERPENVKKQISESRKGQKWVCKPWVQPKQIPQNEIQLYIDNGWQLGKLIKQDNQYYKWDSKTKTWFLYTPKTLI